MRKTMNCDYLFQTARNWERIGFLHSFQLDIVTGAISSRINNMLCATWANRYIVLHDVVWSFTVTRLVIRIFFSFFALNWLAIPFESVRSLHDAFTQHPIPISFILVEFISDALKPNGFDASNELTLKHYVIDVYWTEKMRDDLHRLSRAWASTSTKSCPSALIPFSFIARFAFFRLAGFNEVQIAQNTHNNYY